ncbi:MAG: type II toxin-antitoxin system HipA family toxin [Alphaproteobacteria bacterium]|nr:type II toxin-antitoxin system HipA family toxin [Alphaproteobacteria bacterium]
MIQLEHCIETQQVGAPPTCAGSSFLPPGAVSFHQAMFHGSSLGGARPKAMIEDGDKKLIAKFSSSSDTYNVVKAEFIAMRLAAKAGLTVAPVRLTNVAGKDVLLVERFDRMRTNDGWQRRAMVSALTNFGLDEMMARYASYADLTKVIRHRFSRPKDTLRELFGLLVFNILCGNTDDHARNHAAFWEGKALTLTPAYDICPQNRAGNEASQAMLITDNNRRSTLATCMEAAPNFLLDKQTAAGIIQEILATMRTEWEAICNEARLSEVDRNLFWGRISSTPTFLRAVRDSDTVVKDIGHRWRRLTLNVPQLSLECKNAPHWRARRLSNLYAYVFWLRGQDLLKTLPLKSGYEVVARADNNSFKFS